jgi:2-hydroxychromene-2-carboxylate isomerase
MGEVIALDDRRAARTRNPAAGAIAPRVAFHFDVTSPWTYLAAERVDRRFGALSWIPVAAADGPPTPAARARAEERGRRLGLPLVWPDGAAAGTAAPARVAALAAERGRAAAFTLAAGRLAYCGGYDLADPEVLAEAAAVAGLALVDALVAARDGRRDAGPQRAARRLTRVGAVELPVVQVGRRLFGGEQRIGEAVAFLAALRGSARAGALRVRGA